MVRRLIVEFDAEQPPCGRVVWPDGRAVAFSGWTELAAALAPGAGSPADDEEPSE